jgi:hypothetical protein
MTPTIESKRRFAQIKFKTLSFLLQLNLIALRPLFILICHRLYAHISLFIKAISHE